MQHNFLSISILGSPSSSSCLSVIRAMSHIVMNKEPVMWNCYVEKKVTLKIRSKWNKALINTHRRSYMRDLILNDDCMVQTCVFMETYSPKYQPMVWPPHVDRCDKLQALWFNSDKSTWHKAQNILTKRLNQHPHQQETLRYILTKKVENYAFL